MKFNGNVKMKIERLSGFDDYGRPTVSAISESRCSIVRLSTESAKTAVRADSSASNGNAKELVSDSRLLVNLSANLKVGDKITVGDIRLMANKIIYRYDVGGKENHLQVDCSIWA